MEQGQTVTAHHRGARFTGKLGATNKHGEATLILSPGVDMLLPLEAFEPLNEFGPMTEEEAAA